MWIGELSLERYIHSKRIEMTPHSLHLPVVALTDLRGLIHFVAEIRGEESSSQLVFLI
jgi:hypothetical protein